MEERSTVFGSDAARYDRTRPGYPAELIDALVTALPMRVLDAGCGTGIASRLFANRGCSVLGVEPDARMAAVARDHGIEVEVARLEDWVTGGRVFDAVISAQAWHWVDRVLGPRIARDVLRTGGTLAILWNVPRHDPDVQRVFDEIYDRFRLPDGTRCSPPAGLADTSDRFVAGIEAAGGFAAPVERTWSWSLRYTAAQWIDLLPSHSDHRLLADDVLAGLLQATKVAIDHDFDGHVDVAYTTRLVTAVAI